MCSLLEIITVFLRFTQFKVEVLKISFDFCLLLIRIKGLPHNAPKNVMKETRNSKSTDLQAINKYLTKLI